MANIGLAIGSRLAFAIELAQHMPVVHKGYDVVTMEIVDGKITFTNTSKCATVVVTQIGEAVHLNFKDTKHQRKLEVSRYSATPAKVAEEITFFFLGFS